MVKQYQVVLDPDRLRAYGMPVSRVRTAIMQGNQEVGGSVVELAEARGVAWIQAFISGSLIHIVAFGVSHDHEKHVEPVAQFQDWGYRLGILIGLFLVFTSPQLAA